MKNMKAFNYDKNEFRVVENSASGEVSAGMRFFYRQSGNIVSCSYHSDEILSGHLIGTVNDDGSIDLSYHQVNCKSELRTGICHSTPEILPSGKIRLREK